MKKEDFTDALSALDTETVAEALNYRPASAAKPLPRKKKFRLASLIAAAAVLLCAAIVLAALPLRADAEFLTPEVFSSDRRAVPLTDNFRRAYADLALELLRTCGDGGGSRTMVSPLSVITALSMAANGAEGETLAQMLALLGSDSLEQLNEQLFSFYDHCACGEYEASVLRFSNGLWLTNDKSFRENPDFVKQISNTYRADIAKINFSSPNADKAINQWCREKTNGMIPQIVQPGDLDGDTAAVLINALSFDGQWTTPYPDFACRDAVFHAGSGDTTVTMMYGDDGDYLSGEGFTGFLKPYRGRRYAFAALLPDEGSDAAALLSSLDGEAWLQLCAERQTCPIITGLPQFSADFERELRDDLTALGMTDAFDPEKADFSLLGKSVYGNLFISSVRHKTHIEVDQMGTKAAAVTSIILEAGSAAPTELKRVILDRPFVYAILDLETGLPVFLGTCDF